MLSQNDNVWYDIIYIFFSYILSLAIADLLVIVSSVPFTAVIYIVDHWPWGEMICRISETAKDISVAVSIFTLTALSGDRFFAIVDPLKKFHTSGEFKFENENINDVLFLIAWPSKEEQ